MREIKFRAWSNDHNRYCDFVSLVSPNEKSRWIGWIKSSGVYLTAVDIALEQYTGLKDKNGKEIYEGDIVKLYDNNYITIWRETDFAYIFSSKRQHYWLSKSKSEECTVVGNIHENPELLGDEE